MLRLLFVVTACGLEENPESITICMDIARKLNQILLLLLCSLRK